ncbi:MAG: protein-L-isoaspartate(D-aspartate) O-methyltransferase [Candidatus Woesearchaeota archaeon]
MESIKDKEFSMQKKKLLESWITEGIIDKDDKLLINVFLKVKREDFVIKEYRDFSYADTALPFIKEATISQPTVIMMMLKNLNLTKGSKVLEIGTGSGYQTAMIALIAEKVISIEIDKDVFETAKKNLAKFKARNIKLVLGDGKNGFKEEAPFDRIIINAACEEIPKNLLKQLKNNGVLVAPVGKPYQSLIVAKKNNSKISFEEKFSHGLIFSDLR